MPMRSLAKFVLPLFVASVISARAASPVAPQDSANMDASRDLSSKAGFLTDTNRSFPMLFIVGDSTVHNLQKTERGWGDVIGKYFETNKIRVENHALGGRSSRTFITQGWWQKVLDAAKPGDFVLLQMGHNDAGQLDDTNRARGTIRGLGEDTKDIFNPITKQPETVHTYGWYLRKYIRDAKAAGATPIVCSLVPRKTWQDGKMSRQTDTYAGWAKEVAAQEGVAFIDLNDLVATRYEALGAEKVEVLFADLHTHTSKAGADLNAEILVGALKKLPGAPLDPFLIKAK
jgi:lysophospholipase L1-like esterase